MSALVPSVGGTRKSTYLFESHLPHLDVLLTDRKRGVHAIDVLDDFIIGGLA